MSLFLLAIGENQVSDEQISSIKNRLPSGMSFVQTVDEDKILELASDVEICAGWTRPKWLKALPNLKWVQVWSAGANWILKHPELAERPFILTNGSGIHAVSISEHILGVMLQHGRHLRHAHDAQKAHVWARMQHPSEPDDGKPFTFNWDNIIELADRTILILGVGAIGERTAKLAQAFDMHVIGVRHNPAKGSPYVDEMIGNEQLHDVLPRADFIINTLPSTPDTINYIGASEFDLMKPTVYIVNIGRGDTMDEAMMLEALKSKRIAGAALDVFATEPLPEDAPHWEIENLFITPHYSGSTPRYHERAVDILLDNLQRFQAGEPLRNVVDKEKGY